MRSQTVPSYGHLFQDKIGYPTLLNGLSQESVITICIALINELSINEEKYSLQKRIYSELSVTFSPEEKAATDSALTAFWKTINMDFGVLFHRSYLLKMILRELNSFRAFDDSEEIPKEFAFFKAYMHLVTDINREQAQKIDFKNLSDDKMERTLEFLWKPTISIYEFNEKPNLPFELFRLMTFLNFARENYHEALGEYLQINHQKSIGNLLHSFNQVNKTAMAVDANARLKRLAYLNPDPNVDTTHLERQAINKVTKSEYTIADLKAYPLYLTSKRGYMVIDPDYYMRKNYYGPFFEIRNQTSLKDKISFNSYSSQVSQALEANCFRPIFTMLCEGLNGKLKTDDRSPNAPDGYFRIGKLIFVFEYKASIFHEALSQTTDIKKISAFIDQKFVSSEGSQKGITQLEQKLTVLASGGYEDDKLTFNDDEEKYRVYPVIVHHDFYFSLPGVNNYLQSKFNISDVGNKNLEVMPLLIMNLVIMYELLTKNINITILDRMFVDYYNFLSDKKKKLHSELGDKTNIFLEANMSFDEYFNQYILKYISMAPDDIAKSILSELFNRARISFDVFNEPFNFQV
jgi:hypothetical protein